MVTGTTEKKGKKCYGTRRELLAEKEELQRALQAAQQAQERGEQADEAVQVGTSAAKKGWKFRLPPLGEIPARLQELDQHLERQDSEKQSRVDELEQQLADMRSRRA